MTHVLIACTWPRDVLVSRLEGGCRADRAGLPSCKSALSGGPVRVRFLLDLDSDVRPRDKLHIRSDKAL